MSIITPNIDTASKIPVYTQIYRYIRNEIENGRLACKDRLPSTRALSSHLLVSRNTIDMAYGQLVDEGYIESIPKRGYFVCDISTNLKPIGPYEKQPAPAAAPKPVYDFEFSPYGVDLENFPYGTWRKTMRDILYDERNTHLFESGHRQGDLDFREAIAAYLHQSRGVVCTPKQIIVGAGVDYLLLLLAQILGPATIFAMENPSYMQAWRILTHLGFNVCPIGLDKYGMDMHGLTASPANVAYITPSHHFPMGIVMPIGRRQEILAWAAAREDRYIIEDDYDSEFRYKGRPIPSLQGIDTRQKVIYLGTFSKAIAPSMRISYLVLPPRLLDIYREHYSFYSNTVPRTEQKQMTEFIRQGPFERHLTRMRMSYKNKRDYILKALEPYRRFIAISGENSGLHLLIRFLDGRSEAQLLWQARQCRLRLFGLSEYMSAPLKAPDTGATLILGYASLTSRQLKDGMARFIKCFFPDSAPDAAIDE